MAVLGKFTPTNRVSLWVQSAHGLQGRPIRARLLENDGTSAFEGTLQVTRGNFINTPKPALLAWLTRCGRILGDIRGPATARNTVHYFVDAEGWWNLHFQEYSAAGERVPDAQ